jgi:hypothetical protein
MVTLTISAILLFMFFGYEKINVFRLQKYFRNFSEFVFGLGFYFSPTLIIGE